jgi:undecaprenol kinase
MTSKIMDRIKKFGKSIKHAFRGLAYVFRYEKNFQNQVVIAILVVIGMFYFKLTRGERIILVLVIMEVLVMELLNTVVERVVDILKPRVHPYARLIKDLMASAVLVSALLAIVIGAIIFLPHLRAIF